MTLIVGIRCEDGVVLGADGAATYGVMGQQTIRQTFKKKLKVLPGEIIIGTSGPVGLGQRLANTVEIMRTNGSLFKDINTNSSHLYKPVDVMRCLRMSFWKDIEMEGNIARASAQMFGPFAMQGALGWTALAMVVGSEPCLFQFDQSASPEMATEDLPFVALGSGQMIADPFLALIRRLFWPDRLPTLAEGRFAVFWTLHHAILTHPGGVAEPKQIVALQLVKPHWKAVQLSEEDLQEHQEHVSRVENCISNFDHNIGSEEPPRFVAT